VKRVALELVWIALVGIAIFYAQTIWDLYAHRTTPEAYVPRAAPTPQSPSTLVNEP